MNYKLLGRSGVRVSEIALGTMTLSKTNPWEWGIDKEGSLDILRTYSEAGGNYIDTANNYQNGQSEEIIGEFIKGDRDRYFIATKFTLHNNNYKEDPNFGGNSRKNLLRSVNASLDRLGTDYIDMLYLHVWDYTTSIREVMKSLNILIEQTKINYIAISDTPVWVAASANAMAHELGWEEFTAFQFPFNIGRQDAQHELIPFCRYNDLAMMPWSVLSAGLFTGKYTRSDDASGRIAKSVEDMDEDRLALARTIDDIADELEVTSAEVTIAWTRQQDPRLIPIIGATKASHIQTAIDATELELEDDTIDRLDEAAGFEKQFPQSFTSAENVLNFIHGETHESLDNHRFYGY